MACRQCKQTTLNLFHGLRSITKALLGIDRASKTLMMHRKALCSLCPHAIACRSSDAKQLPVPPVSPPVTPPAVGTGWGDSEAIHADPPIDPCWCGKLWDGLRSEHGTCGCNIGLKIKVRSEKCPLDAW